MYDLRKDPKELKNVAENPAYSQEMLLLKSRLYQWQNVTADPWICSPTAVLEDSGSYKQNPTCMALDNGLR